MESLVFQIRGVFCMDGYGLRQPLALPGHQVLQLLGDSASRVALQKMMMDFQSPMRGILLSV